MSLRLEKNPDMLYAKEIVAYREEMLAAESSMDGCGSLRRHENPQEWIAYNALLSNPATVPEGDRGEIIAAVSAAIATVLGESVSGIRIVSFKKAE